MRLDRFITLNLVGPFRSVMNRISPSPHRGEGRGEVLPILMYHSISDDPEIGVPAYYRTATSPAVFRQHMTLLRSLGCIGIDLKRGLENLHRVPSLLGERAKPGREKSPIANRNSEVSMLLNRPVVLTFDDGFRDFYAAAFPILREFGFTATMFLPTAYIQESRSPALHDEGEGSGGTMIASPNAASVRRSFKGTQCLTWSEVRELHRAGIEFGSHTVNHPKLVELDWPEIKTEISDSKSEIEHQLGAPVTSFAYPFAYPQAHRAFGDVFRDRLRETGYENCVTTTIGRAHPQDDLYRLRRLPANSDDDDRFLRGKIEGAYDWLAGPQALIKKLKASVRDKSARVCPAAAVAAKSQSSS